MAWYRRNNDRYYFDSYGLQPPKESPVLYNSERLQPANEVFCGHRCLYVLKQLSLGRNFPDVINDIF